jgi:autotransporter passenger strand-loop-strand repeat protein
MTVYDQQTVSVILLGVVSATSVQGGGNLVVASGGTAYTTIVSGAVTGSASQLMVFGGGTAYDTTVDSGGMVYLAGAGSHGEAAVGSGGTINNGGQLIVSSGAAADRFMINSGGALTLLSGGVASGTSVYGNTVSGGMGFFEVFSGGVAYDTTLNSDCQMMLLGGAAGDVASASGAVIHSGGTLYVWSAANAYDVTVDTGGAEYISGGFGDAPENLDGTISDGGSLYVFSGGVDTGTTVNSDGKVMIYDGGSGSEAVDSGGTISLCYGGWDGHAEIYGTVYNSGGETYDETIERGGRLFVSAGGIDSGVTVVSGGGVFVSSGGAELNAHIAGGALWLGSDATASGGIFFTGSSGTLRLARGETHLSAAISGFGATDSIDLIGVASTSSDSLHVSGNDITVTSGGTSYSLDVTGAAALHLGLVIDHSGGIDIESLCFLRGTRILTPGGAVEVETLRIGDAVITRFNGVRPIKWIGRQRHETRSLRSKRAHYPVRIRPGALGKGLPARDLFVSPGHSMLLGETLVLASSLVNGVTITQDWAPEVIEYYQIEFETHDCVVAEGAWSESYADAPGMRAQFRNAAEYYELYPDDPEPECLRLCAPRPARGLALEDKLRPIVARAASGLKPGPLRGGIDGDVGGLEIEGWAFDEANPALPVLLEVLAGDRVIGTVLACDFRADLAEAGFAQSRCGFSFYIPQQFRTDKFFALRVRRAGDGAELDMAAPCRAIPPQPRRAA